MRDERVPNQGWCSTCQKWVPLSAHDSRLRDHRRTRSRYGAHNVPCPGAHKKTSKTRFRPW